MKMKILMTSRMKTNVNHHPSNQMTRKKRKMKMKRSQVKSKSKIKNMIKNKPIKQKIGFRR